MNLHAIKQSTNFTNLAACRQQKMHIIDLLAEPDSFQCVLRLPKGMVVNEGHIITQQEKILKDTETFQQNKHNSFQKADTAASQQAGSFAGDLVVLSSPGQSMWYHWLLQVLPRLYITVKSGISYDKIYIANLRYPWQQASLNIVLEKLGISHEQLFHVESPVAIQAENLIVPSIPFIPSTDRDSLPHWLKSFLHDCFVKEEVDLAHTKRIYISRSKAAYRRITNEDEVTDYLASKEFIVLHLEDIPPSEQATLFHQAEIIVGPHGSGFTNLIFSQPNTKVVEIEHYIKNGEQRSFFPKMTDFIQGIYYPFYVDEVDIYQQDNDLFVDMTSFKLFFDTHILPS